MRFALVALFFAASASAAKLSLTKRNYPTCALPCLANPDLGGCDNVNDLTCVCHSSTFIDSTSACIAGVCTGSDLDQANETARQACLAVGVTITSVSTAAPSSTASSPSASATSPAASSTAASSAAGSSSAASSSGSSSAAASSPTSNAASSTGANILVGGAAILGAFLAL